MPNKKVPAHIIFSLIYILLVFIKLIPYASSSKECLLGYNALCSFSPISALLLLGLPGLHIFLYAKSQTKKFSRLE